MPLLSFTIYMYIYKIITILNQQQTLTKDRITDPAEQLRYLTTPRSNIRLEILVHEGTFGRVYKGVFKRGDTYEEVLVKTVSGMYIRQSSKSIFLFC